MKKNIKLLIATIVFTFSLSTIMTNAMQKKEGAFSKDSYINNFKISSDTESENEDETQNNNQIPYQPYDSATVPNNEYDPAENNEEYENLIEGEEKKISDLSKQFNELTNNFKELQDMFYKQNKKQQFKNIDKIHKKIKANKHNPFQYNTEDLKEEDLKEEDLKEEDLKKDLEKHKNEMMFNKIFDFETKVDKYKDDFEELQVKEKIKNSKKVTESKGYYYKSNDEDKKEDPANEDSKASVKQEYNNLMEEVFEYIKDQEKQPQTIDMKLDEDILAEKEFISDEFIQKTMKKIKKDKDIDEKNKK